MTDDVLDVPRARVRQRTAAMRRNMRPGSISGRYGSPEIECLRDVVAGYRKLGSGRGAVLRYALRRPRTLLRAAAYVARLPVLTVDVSATPSGRAITSELRSHGGTFGGLRLMSAALTLPDDEASYLRGKARQAVRTNVTRAREAGVTCRAITEHDDKLAVIDALVAAGGPDPRESLVDRFATDPAFEFFAAELHGELISLCVMPVDQEAALIAYHVSVPGHEQTSNGRWLLSLHLINECIRRGARHLLIETSPMDIDSGLEYFQRRLGFSVYNLRLRNA